MKKEKKMKGRKKGVCERERKRVREKENSKQLECNLGSGQLYAFSLNKQEFKKCSFPHINARTHKNNTNNLKKKGCSRERKLCAHFK